MIYDYDALFLASGMGLGAFGFQNATAKLGTDTARFRIVGGVDNDKLSNADFYMLTRGRAIELAGTSSLKWRERIGNAVPEGAGRAVGKSLLKALLASTLGTWFLSNDEIWVRQVDHYVMPEDRGEAQVYQ